MQIVAYPFLLFIFVRLLSAEARKVFLYEVHDVDMLCRNISLSHANVYVSALREELCRTCSILEDEQRHHDVASHVVQTACEEVLHLLEIGRAHV